MRSGQTETEGPVGPRSERRPERHLRPAALTLYHGRGTSFQFARTGVAGGALAHAIDHMPLHTPRLKIIRRLGTPLPGLTRKMPKDDARAAAVQSRPGAHARRKPSVHRLRLEEKQKLRFHYGVSERQMRRYVEAARRQPGAVGENLLVLLERRLDNVVFRLGIAPTIRAARQLVVHRHIEVNARRLDRPGYLVCAGDAVALRPAGRERVVSMPIRSDVPFPVREALVIAYYAR